MIFLALPGYDLPCMLASQCLHCHALPICQYVWCSSSYLRHETENTEQLWLAFTSPLINSFVAASVILWFLWRTSSLAASNFSKNSEEKLFYLFLFSNVVPNTSLWILPVKRGGRGPKIPKSFPSSEIQPLRELREKVSSKHCGLRANVEQITQM